jgi:hypothetical protein
MRRVLNSRLSVASGSCLVCMWLMVFMLCFDAAPSGATEISGTPCPTAPTRDFSAPMRHFPAIRQVPTGGNLPFGPRDALLSSLSGPVQAGGGRLGFRLMLNRRPPLKRRLEWQMDLRVIRLDARGKERGLVAQRRTILGLDREVGAGAPMVLALVSGTPAYFRLDIAIRKKSGVALGRYSEYVRVVPARVNVKLLVSPDVVAPDGVIRSRIQNRGSVTIGYRVNSFRLERRTEMGWRNVQLASPSEWTGLPAKFGIIVGGGLSFCAGLRIPPEAIPGAYRLSERFSATGHSRALRAEFQVR